MAANDYCIWNGTDRKIVFRPFKDVECELKPFPGMLRLNRTEYEVILEGGLFKSLERRGQVSRNRINKTADQKTSEKSAPDELKPKKGPQGRNEITHKVSGAGSIDDVIVIPASDDPVNESAKEGNAPAGNKGGNKNGNRTGK